MDAETRRVLADYQREISRLSAKVDSLQRGQRTPQLAHSSLEEGQTIEARDETGATRQLIGWLPDGTVGMVTEGGDPVSAPTEPTVTPSLGGLRVTWDGLLDGDTAIPGDFDHMAVHVSTTSGFTPSAATYVGGIRRAGDGGMLPVVPLPYVPHYVVLVPVTTGGVQGTPSAEATATPLQTSGIDLEADSVEAVHIQAGAVEADKLEAILVLASTIIAGIPGAARVELDEDGLRGYNELNELVFAIDASGNAVFSGNITGSEISGSRMTIGSSGNTGVIEDVSGTVRLLVDSSDGPRAEMRASATQSVFAVWADPDTPEMPTGGVLAQDDKVVFYAHSVEGDPTSPWTEQTAFPGEARTRWSSGDGSEVQVRALPDYASILLSAPPATDPDDAQSAGFLFAQRYSANDIAAVSMQGPVWEDDTGPEHNLRAMIFVEGARPERAYTRVVYAAKRHRVQGESLGSVYDETSDGVLELVDTHSILAPRHAPVRTDMVTQPTASGDGNFQDFTSGQMPDFTFTTGWSGRTRVTITMCGINNSTNASTISLGFRLSGAGTVPASLTRAAMVRSTGAGSATNAGRKQTETVYLDLAGNSTYTLTPVWRISGSTAWSADQKFDLNYQNSVVVEPLM